MWKRAMSAFVVVCLLIPSVLAASSPACPARDDVQAPGVTARATIGEVAYEVFETPHPYPLGNTKGEIVWRDTITRKDATYITVHFDRFELAPEDRLELSDAKGRVVHVYTGRGYLEKGGDFWGLSVPGDTMQIRLFSGAEKHDAYGMRIDRFAHGFPEDDEPGSDKAICGTEDFRDVACYQSSHPLEYERSRAVVKLIIGGTRQCTGWLASCDNHVITNEHCIESQSQLNGTEFQFMYQRPNCGSGAPVSELQLMGGTLLRNDEDLDYALILPNLAGHDPQATYGYLRLDPRLPAIDERIYIPGHPSGVPKRLSLESTHSSDPSGYCEVYTTSANPCSGGPGDIGYYCDTEGGSSGSPVLSGINHKAVALHHCANCPNRGVSILDVYNDIQASPTPLPACSTGCEVPPAPTNLSSINGGDRQIDLTWNASAGAATYNLYRSDGTCPATDPVLLASGLTGTAYSDTAVERNGMYAYFVTALDSSGECESEPSNCRQMSVHFCGNGIREVFEICDGADLGGATCDQEDCGFGDPSCTEDCELDFSCCLDCADVDPVMTSDPPLCVGALGRCVEATTPLSNPVRAYDGDELTYAEGTFYREQGTSPWISSGSMFHFQSGFVQRGQLKVTVENLKLGGYGGRVEAAYSVDPKADPTWKAIPGCSTTGGKFTCYSEVLESVDTGLLRVKVTGIPSLLPPQQGNPSRGRVRAYEIDLLRLSSCECSTGQDCDDGIFCNRETTCSAEGYCEVGEIPCPSCACDEDADICDEADCPPCPAEHGCGDPPCRAAWPRDCTEYDTGLDSCFKTGLGAVQCEPEGSTIHVTNCVCTSGLSGPPYPICQATDQHWVCE